MIETEWEPIPHLFYCYVCDLEIDVDDINDFRNPRCIYCNNILEKLWRKFNDDSEYSE